jgi:hypothetical protein
MPLCWQLCCCCARTNALITLVLLPLLHFLQQSMMPAQQRQQHQCNKGFSAGSTMAKDTSNRVSLLSLCPRQRPCCTGIVATVTLSLSIKDASTTMAKISVQRGRWCGCNNNKDTSNSNRGNTTIIDASATMATMPVQQGGWCGRNNGKDTSNRGNTTDNNQQMQQKDERVDNRSGVEDATQGNWAADDTTRGGG